MRYTIERLVVGAVLLGIVLGIFAVVYNYKRTPPLPKQTLANPASVNCKEKGGTLEIKTRGDGGGYGVCIFEDNMQCEEWALFRGDCPVGGIKIAGYDSEAQVYCAISGGQTLAEGNATCTFPNGTVCSAQGYFDGVCGIDSDG